MKKSEKAAAIGVPLAVIGWVIGVFFDHMLLGLVVIFAPFYFFRWLGLSSGHPFDFLWRRK